MVLVTIWCSNNIPSIKCTHVNFWFVYSLRSSLSVFSCFNASLFLICVVLSRNCYACFKFFVLFYFFLERFGTCLRMLWMSVETGMFFALSPDPQSNNYPAHFTIAVMFNVQRTNTDAYFSHHEILSTIMSSAKNITFFHSYLCILFRCAYGSTNWSWQIELRFDCTNVALILQSSPSHLLNKMPNKYCS